MKQGAPSIAFFAMEGNAKILQAFFVLLNLPSCFLSKQATCAGPGLRIHQERRPCRHPFVLM
jgi:hypothetical protein